MLLYRIVGFTKPDPFSGPSFRWGESPSGSFRRATRTEQHFGSSEFNAERTIKLIGVYQRKIGKYFCIDLFCIDKFFHNLGNLLLQKVDLEQLSKQWTQLNNDWKEKEQESLSGHPDTSHAKVTQLWTEVLAFRRQLIDLKMTTQRDLITMGSDMSNTGKRLTSACLDVYTKADCININGRETRIGTKEELWTQLQRCRVEKKVLEKKVNTLEREVITFKSKTHSLERSVHDEQLLNSSLKEENDNLSRKVCHTKESSVQSTRMQSSTNLWIWSRA